MSAVRFQAQSVRAFEEFRRALDHAVVTSRVAHLLQHAWTGRVMTIRGPGAHGLIRYGETGSVHAELHISFPASLMRGQIVGDVRRMLAEAVGNHVSSIG
jgi:hypothetical protein